jgi:hypothetical protein
LYVPTLVNVCAGFRSVVSHDGHVAPSPKFQHQVVGPPVLASVNCTTSGGGPDPGLGLVVIAGPGGAGAMAMIPTVDHSEEPWMFVVLRLTVYGHVG